MKTPTISIVMPAYNISGYISESIKSVLNQTFCDFELIVVDDGSTDNTKDVVKAFEDERIILIENPHDFIRSYNSGIRAAKGEYIVRMDADDIMLPHRLQVQLEYMENNPGIDVCGSWMETFGATQRLVKTPVEHDKIAAYLLRGNPLNHPTTILRKKSLLSCGMYPNLYKSSFIFAEDYKLWVDLIRKGLYFANIPEVLLYYRISDKQASVRHHKKQMKNTFRIQQQYTEYVSSLIVKANPNLYDYFNSTIHLINKGQISFSSFQSVVSDLQTATLSARKCVNKQHLLTEKPLVSIVMPVWNTEQFICDSVQSILNQSYDNIELIIINDGSSDQTADRVKSMKDSRIIFIDHSENKGNYIRRNEGCRQAKGKYICVMDGDDIAMPERIKRQVEIMENDGSLLAHGTAFMFSNGEYCYKPHSYDRIKVMLLFDNMFLHPSLMVRKDTLESVGYYNEKYLYASDYDLVCKIALQGKIINIPDILMHYRIHKEQISATRFSKQAEYADQIRLNYLEKCGFRLTSAEKEIFTQLMGRSETGENKEAQNRSIAALLEQQNKALKHFNPVLLNSFLEDILQQKHTSG